MAELSVLHWEDHQVVAETVDEVFVEAKRLYDELVARGGFVASVSIRTKPPEAAIRYRVESDDQLPR